MPDFKAPKKYDHLVDWLSSSLNEKICTSLEKAGVNEAAELNQAFSAARDTVSKCNDENKPLSDEAKKALTDLSQKLEDACNNNSIAKYRSFKEYFTYGRALINNAQVIGDNGVSTLSTAGNEAISNSFCTDKLLLVGYEGELMKPDRIDTTLKDIGYDKLWPALTDRINLATRLDSEVVTAKDYNKLREKVEKSNKKLTDNIFKVKNGIEHNSTQFRPLHDEDLEPMKNAFYYSSEQSSALRKGWDISRLGDYNMMKNAVKRCTDQTALDALGNKKNKPGLRNIVSNCEQLKELDLTEKIYHSRSEFEADYQKALGLISSINSLASGKKAGSALNELKQENDYRYKDSVFSDAANRSSGETDIYSAITDRKNNTVHRASMLGGENRAVQKYTAMVNKCAGNASLERINEEVTEVAVQYCKNIKSCIKSVVTKGMLKNERFNKLSAAVDNICSWEQKAEGNIEDKLTVTSDLTYDQMYSALTELENAANDLRQNEPDLDRKLKKAMTEQNGPNAVDLTSTAAKLGHNAAVRLKHRAKGTEFAEGSSTKLYDLTDTFTDKTEKEAEAMDSRREGIENFTKAVAKTSKKLKTAVEKLIADNEARKNSVRRPADDKRSDSYRDLVSSVKLIEKIKDPENTESFTPEQIISAYDHAVKAADRYYAEHTGAKGFFKAGSQVGKERVEYADTIGLELRKERMKLHKPYAKLRDMKKGETLADARTRFEERMDSISGIKHSAVDPENISAADKLAPGSFFESSADMAALISKHVPKEDISRLDAAAISARNNAPKAGMAL